MHTSLLSYLRSRNWEGCAIDYILPKIIKFYRDDFSTIVDCGAGIGHTASLYAKSLRENTDASASGDAQVIAYEPLPENYTRLERRAKADPMIKARCAAVADRRHQAKFVIPTRMTGSSESWGEGTSAVGFIGEIPSAETIHVDAVRLDEESIVKIDFLKLDLQGGELKALIGLGSMIDQVRLVYAEHQMLAKSDGQPLNYLQEKGFTCYFDRLQFGFRGSSSEIPINMIKEAGIEIDRVRLADGQGFPNIFWGSLSIEKTQHLQPNGSFTPEFSEGLRQAGIYYLQTDVLAINIEIYKEVLQIL